MHFNFKGKFLNVIYATLSKKFLEIIRYISICKENIFSAKNTVPYKDQSIMKHNSEACQKFYAKVGSNLIFQKYFSRSKNNTVLHMRLTIYLNHEYIRIIIILHICFNIFM